MITTLNVDDYAGGSSGAPEVTEYPGTIPNVGSTFSFVGYTWLVAHKKNGVAYCVTNNILKNVQWTYNDITTGYFGSNIQIECQKMSISTGIQYADYVLDVGAGKVFIPSYDQMRGESGGFSWFNSNSRRVAKLNGTAKDYWTAVPCSSSAIWVVNSVGYIYTDRVSDSGGFRPCIAIRY